MEMIRAGFGDIVGKYSALNDWKLSHLLLKEPFCRQVYDMVKGRWTGWSAWRMA
ncbi:MAG: hypothetical protein ACLU9S_01965 [Oscillospiraceae bacterium]